MDWAAVARAQDGMISRAQLRAAGLDDEAVRRLIDSGALARRAKGVYLVRGAPMTYRATLWRALLATGGVLGFATAAQLWGMSEEAPARVEVVIPPERRICIPSGVRVHRVFAPSSAVLTMDGLPVTNRAWTLLDHLGRLPWPGASRLADRAIQRSWLRPEDIARRLRDYPGRQGNGMLRRLAAQLGDGAAAESERLLHRLLRRAGIDGWTANLPVWLDGELVAVLDVAIPSARLAIEIDGMAHHTDVDRFQRDRSRQNTLVGLGWTVLRFTWADLVERPGYVIATIRRHVARTA